MKRKATNDAPTANKKREIESAGLLEILIPYLSWETTLAVRASSSDIMWSGAMVRECKSYVDRAMNRNASVRRLVNDLVGCVGWCLTSKKPSIWDVVILVKGFVAIATSNEDKVAYIGDDIGAYYKHDGAYQDVVSWGGSHFVQDRAAFCADTTHAKLCLLNANGDVLLTRGDAAKEWLKCKLLTYSERNSRVVLIKDQGRPSVTVDHTRCDNINVGSVFHCVIPHGWSDNLVKLFIDFYYVRVLKCLGGSDHTIIVKHRKGVTVLSSNEGVEFMVMVCTKRTKCVMQQVNVYVPRLASS
jgi:hypothetical protein